MQVSNDDREMAGDENEGMGSFVHDRIRRAAAFFQRHLVSRQRLLDIGCGAGTPTMFLKEVLSVQEVHAVDMAEASVAAARAKGVSAFVCNLDGERLPFDDHFFDAIFAGEVIEHVVNPDHLLQEVRRTLTKDGLFVLTTPNLASWSNRILLLFGWQPFETGTSLQYEVGRPSFLRLGGGMGEHLHLYTLRALRELLIAHGFEIVGVAQCSGRETERKRRWRWFHVPWLLLDNVMIFVPSLGHRIVLAAKPKQ